MGGTAARLTGLPAGALGWVQGFRLAWAWGTHQERSQAVVLVGKLRDKCMCLL